jgi:hypothetical protein
MLVQPTARVPGAPLHATREPTEGLGSGGMIYFASRGATPAPISPLGPSSGLEIRSR